jgi:uncharacterized protein
LTYHETPLHFDCGGHELVAIVAHPHGEPRVGVIIVVGGPQYRVGSHRQFVLLSRALASAGIACLRFDCRGMGDSEGDPIAFDATASDIDAAITAFRAFNPGLHELILWGLCDGATAGAFAASKAAVSGFALFNPWVRNAELRAQSTMRYYYARRFLGRAFWVKLITGDVEIFGALRTFINSVIRYAGTRRPGHEQDDDLAARLGRAILAAGRPTLVGLSENDQTAAEFRLAARQGPLHEALQRPWVECVEVDGADHTFSSEPWRDRVAALTIRWVSRNFAVVNDVKDRRAPADGMRGYAQAIVDP